MPPALQSRAAGVHLGLGLLVLLPGCQMLPSLQDRAPSQVLTDTAGTRLGQAVSPLVQAHPGLSGVVAINHGRDAFAARALLAASAERSLDVQYYIWHRDLSGTLLFAALRRAADRGVRVRLLLDDANSTPELDTVLAALEAHPRIEVRLFNPFGFRRWHILGYLTDFPRLNRRMHNKSFTADNQVTIIGGRNVGDEYFGMAQEMDFVDLDVLAVGPVVTEVSRDFDAYWASGSAYPVDRLLPRSPPAAVAAMVADQTWALDQPAAQPYREALNRPAGVPALLERRLDFEWTTIRMVSDHPAKGLGRVAPADRLLPRLRAILGDPATELQIVSPYFVPTAAGTEALTALAAAGVQVSVLTNSLEATDVTAVHAGYAKWRKSLLQAGITLYEMKRLTPAPAPVPGSRKLAGQSISSLHAKTSAIDRTRVFIGSFNFDPRSVWHNTEMGFVIESPAKARAIAAFFREEMAAAAYQVRLDEAGRLIWVEQSEGTVLVHRREPGASLGRRATAAFLSWLPIDWLL